MVWLADDGFGGGGSAVLASGSALGKDLAGPLGSAIEAAGVGAVLQIRLTAPVPWPEWVGPVNVLQALADAVGPLVPQLLGVWTDDAGRTLVIRWSN